MAAQLISMLALGVFAAPDELGKFLLGLAIAAPFATFSGLRFDSAIPSARTIGESHSLLVLALVSIVGVTGTAAALILWARSIDLFALAQLSSVSIAVIIGIMLATSLGQAGRYMAIRSGDLSLIAKATYVRGAVTLLLRGLVIAAMMRGALAIPVQGAMFLLSELVSVAVTAAILRPRDVQRRIASRSSRLHAVARRNWKFPLVESPSTILDTFSANAPIYLITQFFGLGAAGAFGLAFRAMAAPAGQVSLAMTEVLQSRYSILLRAGNVAAIKSMFMKSSVLMLALGTIGYVISFMLLEPLIIFALGERMRLFAQVSVAILPWVILLIVVNLNSRLIALFRRQELKLIYDIYSLAAVLVLIIAFLICKPNYLIFINWIVATQIFGYLIYWLLMFYLFKSQRNRQQSTI